MDFDQSYSIIKDKFMSMDLSRIGKDFSAVIDFTDSPEGFIYLAYIDGCKIIEPVKTEKADIFVSITNSLFEDILRGNVDPVQAFTTGQVHAKGNVMLAMSLYNSLM